MGIGKAGTKYLDRPLRMEEIDGDGIVDVNIAMEFSDIVESDFETYLDIISELAIGNILLQEISVEPVDIGEQDEIILHVTGYVNLNEMY